MKRKNRHEVAWERVLVGTPHPADRYLVLARWGSELVYVPCTRDWPDCVREDLAWDWSETFARWGRRL